MTASACWHVAATERGNPLMVEFFYRFMLLTCCQKCLSCSNMNLHVSRNSTRKHENDGKPNYDHLNLKG